MKYALTILMLALALPSSGAQVFNDAEVKSCIRGFIDEDPINADPRIATLYCACMAEEVNTTVLPDDLIALKANNGEPFRLKLQSAKSKCIDRIRQGSASAAGKPTHGRQLFGDDFRGKCIQGWIDRGRSKEDATQLCNCLTNDLNSTMTKENMDSAISGNRVMYDKKFNASLMKCSSRK